MPKTILRSRRVLTERGLRPAALVVDDGRIESVLDGPGPKKGRIHDFGELVLLPGLVDTHVHINEPGRAQWEGFETATKAAAAAGVTALVDMPLNSIPATTSAAALRLKREAAEGSLWVDCGFWGGVVPGNAGELEGMIDDGALGFKAFLIDSGIEEFPAAAEADLRRAMPVLARRGVPLLVHAELDCGGAGRWSDATRYAEYLASRPRAWENEAVRLVIRLCRETGCRVHVVHLSSAEAAVDIRAAKREGLPVTAETCPHYLCLCAEEIEPGRTEYKCAPPIRERDNRERLWEALGEGVVDFVVSDHSPCAPELKRLESGDFQKAWGGIASVQLGLSAVWTQARRRGVELKDVIRWMSAAPAAFAGLSGKGALAPGKDADVVAWDPDASWTVAPEKILHRHKLTPYAGSVLSGAVAATFLRGERIYDHGKFAGPVGKALGGSPELRRAA